VSATFDALAERLDEISEEIAEVALTELKAAIRRGEQKRPATERTLSQARRAVEKAAHLLRHLDAATADGVESDDLD
jgi:hypothetical protein